MEHSRETLSRIRWLMSRGQQDIAMLEYEARAPLRNLNDLFLTNLLNEIGYRYMRLGNLPKAATALCSVWRGRANLGEELGTGEIEICISSFLQASEEMILDVIKALRYGEDSDWRKRLFLACVQMVFKAYFEKELFEKASILLREGLQQARESKDCNVQCTFLNQLAMCLGELGEMNESLALRKEDLKLTKEFVGEYHPSYATSLSNLGVFYLKIGEWEESRKALTKALELRQHLLGNHADTKLTASHLEGLAYSIRSEIDDCNTQSGQRKCAGCDTISAKKMKRCGGCGVVLYCSQKHQRMHWSVHKSQCSAFVEVLRTYDASSSGSIRPVDMQKHFQAFVPREKIRLSDCSEIVQKTLQKISRMHHAAGILTEISYFALASSLYSSAFNLFFEKGEILSKEIGFPAIMTNIFLQCAELWERDKNFTEAISILGILLSHDDCNLEGRKMRARLYESENELSKALAEYRIAFDIEAANDNTDICRVAAALGKHERDTDSQGVGAFFCGVCNSSAKLLCSGCRGIRYCSAKCQKKDWKQGHKAKCADLSQLRKNEKNGSHSGFYPAAIPHSPLETSIIKFQNVGFNGAWYAGLPLKRVYRRLELSYRLRRTDVLEWKKEMIGSYEGFLDLGAAKMLLPPYWSDENRRDCLNKSTSTIGEKLVKSDVVKKYGYESSETFVLRSISAAVYGTQYMNNIRV